MAFHIIVLLSVLTHTSFKGSKVLVSLYALELGATPIAIGALFSVYSIFPVVLSLYAGRISDRYGYRLPMVFGSPSAATSWTATRAWPRRGQPQARGTTPDVARAWNVLT